MIDGLRFPAFGASSGNAPPPRTPARSTSDRPATLRVLEATRETEANLTITTDEGDTLTLSLRSERDETLAFYRRPGSGAHAGGRVAALEVSTSRDVQLTIQGDLSDQERADVSALIQRLAPVIQGMVAGNGAGDPAPPPGALPDSLSSFTLDVTRSESVVAWNVTGAGPATHHHVALMMLEGLLHRAERGGDPIAPDPTPAATPIASGEPDIGLSKVDPRS